LRSHSTEGSDGSLSRGGESASVSRRQAGEAVGDSGCEVEAAVRELLEIGDDAAFEARWSEVTQRFPNEVRLAGARIRHLIQKKAFEQAIEEVGRQDFGDQPEHLMLKAELLFDAHDADAAEQIYAPLLAQSLDVVTRRNVHLSFAKRLLVNGHLLRADAMLEPVRDILPEGTQAEAVARKAQALVALLGELEGAPLPEGRDERITAMKHAILSFRDRELRPRESAAIGKLSLITGSLGPGGAERQLTRLAVELERARIDHGSIGGIPVDQKVDIVVRSHGPEKQNDFYLHDVQSAGMTPLQINEFKPVSPRNSGVENPELLKLLDYLPSSVNFGVKRLVAYFRESKTDTASMWQDGACLFAGLAALIAGVPHIQLAIRGLPPSMRRHMYRPEYEVFYRAMAEVPGVTFLSNNISAARAYAEWLDIPHDRFSIVYNGVEPMCPDPSPECEQRWARFVEQTPDATHTVGGVFRFDTDKQPLLWVRFAARYLKRHPDARIVLVGGGRLLEHAERLAEELDIHRRILFVGRSQRVGYWMTKMDVLVLLSRYEGLPNVLIEAQYMGVHVVTTPAGGAAECLINGTTGHVLDCAEKPDLENVVRLTHELAARNDKGELFVEGGIGRTFLDSHFSIPHMLVQYVTCTSNALGPCYDEASADRSLEAA
jgi:glycosyltransferase involved in cell wall biosynthesis